MWMTLLALTAAMAEDPEFAGTEKTAEEAEKPESKVSAELGGTYATGNANYYTVNGALNASHKWQRNKLGAVAGLNLGAAVPDTDESGSVSDAELAAGYTQNVERYYADARYDRFFSDRDSLYFLAGAFVDPFAGYDLRTHEQIGYSRIFVDSETTNFVGEIGFDVAQENYVDGVTPNRDDIFAARLMASLTHQFNENVAFSDTVELYENVVDLEDFRLLNTASLSSTINSKLSLKLSHNLLFDNVPVDGFRPLDQTTMLTLVATLL